MAQSPVQPKKQEKKKAIGVEVAGVGQERGWKMGDRQSMESLLRVEV